MKTKLENETTKKRRYDHIDLIEFLGILFVLLYHLTTVKYNILEDSSILTYIHYLIRPILSTCVPLFLFANGFLLINKEFNLKKHIKKTIRFILITVIWGIIVLAILMPLKGEWLTIKNFVSGLLEWKLGWINYLWYMGALCCIYFIFPLIKNAFDHNKKIFNYWTIMCSIFAFGNVILEMAVTIFNHYVLDGNTYISYNFFNIFNPFRGLYGYTFAYFSIGCLIGGNQEAIQEKLKKYPVVNKFSLSAIILISTLLLGMWGIFCTKLTGSVWSVVWNGYNTIFTLINVLAIYQLSTYYKNTGGKIGEYIQLISENTLGIYLIHPIIRQVFENFGVSFLPFANNYIFNILYAFLVMNICLLITIILKKIRIVKKLVT